MPSMPVPTSGASVRSSGTAWRCMLEPIRARLASSFSRNGMSEAATETSWFGDTSIRSTSSARDHAWSRRRGGPRRCSCTSWPFLSISALAWAMVCFSSSRRRVEGDLVGDLAVSPPCGRGLDEAVLVDPRIGGERGDQADVRTFRRLDGADAAVVGGVHVAHLEAGALAGEAAGPEGREPPLVGDLRERVGLVHELRQLARPEELLDHRRHRLGVDRSCGMSVSIS